ncbi:MAG: hypothetical protein WA440_06020 [Ignavibacteriaceae bacterium]
MSRKRRIIIAHLNEITAHLHKGVELLINLTKELITEWSKIECGCGCGHKLKDFSLDSSLEKTQLDESLSIEKELVDK